MDGFVAVTDNEWFNNLRAQPGIAEVNFWRPGGGQSFRALSFGEPLLFKLHSPLNFVVGGGFFAKFAILPVSLAWETFGAANGAASYSEMRARVEQYRKATPKPQEDYKIGCIVLEDPFFLPDSLWVRVPADFKPNTQVGKTYDLASGLGQQLWQQLVGARSAVAHEVAERPPAIPGPVYGGERLGRIRLHQGAFRIMVTEAYARRCAISGERALPVLQAAHIRPVADGGEHRLDNGLLLRSDVHTLFDRGYISVAPDLRVLVSSRLKTDFDNGEPYYRFRDDKIFVPSRVAERPAAEFLEWHADTVFRK